MMGTNQEAEQAGSRGCGGLGADPPLFQEHGGKSHKEDPSCVDARAEPLVVGEPALQACEMSAGQHALTLFGQLAFFRV